MVDTDSSETSPDYIRNMMKNVHSDVPIENRTGLKRLMNKYSDILSKSKFDLGETPLGIHRIDTDDARPVRQTLREQPYDLIPKIDAYVEVMFKAIVLNPALNLGLPIWL